jgi:protein-S-isoprenylcysteine O-methyltransferase Ste14
LLAAEVTRVIGTILILAGVPGVVDSFGRFALTGLGTPAPVAPPVNLVVTGLYRHVRNPMYVGLLSIIFGQALLLGNGWLLLYGAVFWLACHAFVVVYEEPRLERSFGAHYEAFRANVPRWIPRISPWHAP